MSQNTPAQFAAKLRQLPAAVQGRNRKAIEARALVTKQYILAAERRVNPHAKSGSVQFKVAGETAAVRLRGGLPHLTELGSYKAPQGWEEQPGPGYDMLNTPEGPRASVHHPALRARPFWEEGVTASRVPGHKAYKANSLDAAIVATFR